MGQKSPYQNNEESDLEESDDDLVADEMDEEKFAHLVTDYIRQVLEEDYSMDCTLINVRQLKHGYSKHNSDCCNAIYPALFNYMATRVDNSMSKTQVVNLIKKIST